MQQKGFETKLGFGIAVLIWAMWVMLGWVGWAGAAKPILPPPPLQEAKGLISVKQGGTLQVPGATLSVPPRAVAADTTVKLSTLRLDQSAEGNGIEAAVQLTPDSGQSTPLSASALLTFGLPQPQRVGMKIPAYVLLYQLEIDPNSAPANNFPIYLQCGYAVVDSSGWRATVKVPWINQRYVLKDNQMALQKFYQKAGRTKSTSLPTGLFRERADVLNGPRAIILVHGYHSNTSLTDRAHWQTFIDYLAANHASQFRVYTFIYDVQDQVSGISDEGCKLSDAINACPDMPARFMIVGHSMGGLVARSYITQYGGINGLDRLITLASPHHGAPPAIPLWGRYSLYGGFKDVQDKIVGGWWPVINYLKCATRDGSGLENWVAYGDTNPWPLFQNAEKAGRDLSWDNYDRRIPTVAADYRWDKSLLGVSVAGLYQAYPDFMHPSDYLSPTSLDEQRSASRNDFLEQLSLGGPSSDQAFLDRYVLYGGYDPNLSDNASLQQAIVSQVFKFLGDTWALVMGPYGLSWQKVPDPGVAVVDAWANHLGLSYTTARMAETIGVNNTRPYRLNDGLVTLASSLYLASGVTLDTMPNVPLVGGPADLPGFQAHKYRIYPGYDHLSILTGDVPGSTLLEDIVSDLLEAEP